MIKIIRFLVVAVLFTPLLSGILIPISKNEDDKIVGTDSIQKSEGKVSYTVSMIKSPKQLVINVEIYNDSDSIIKINPENFHASESSYALRYIPLGEILASYANVIDEQKLAYQNAQQRASAYQSGTVTTDVNGIATTRVYGNQATTDVNGRATTHVNVGPDPYAQLGLAIAAARTKGAINQAQAQAQAFIDASLAPTELLPKTRCKGDIIFERKSPGSEYRADLVLGDKIISFNFKDAPYFGTDYSDSDAISELDPDGSLAKAGLKKGDKVIAIDGKPVSSLNEFLSIGRQLDIGKTVMVEYQRHGKTKTVLVTIYNAP